LKAIPHTCVQRTIRMIKIIDNGGFSKRLFFVGASGFLASSYSLFATNVIKPALFYTYPPCGRLSSNAGMVIDELTLIGSFLGMLLAGHFADLWGRKKLYGFELALLIIATLGMVQASEGFRAQHPDGTHESTMDIYSWLAWWRFALGVGIGAEACGLSLSVLPLTYTNHLTQSPLVAIITAEWVATKSRGRMLASVFAMQPVARLLAFGVGLAALEIVSAHFGMPPDELDNGDFKTKLVADQVWRWVTGIAIIPAAFAVGLRFTIPETPRYYADILKDVAMAIRKAAKLYTETTPPQGNTEAEQLAANDNNNNDDDSRSQISADSTAAVQGWYTGAWHYLQHPPARNRLLRVSTLMALVDIGWYSLSMDSPSALSSSWNDPLSSSSFSSTTTATTTTNPYTLADASCPQFLSWRTDPSASTSIYRELQSNATAYMLIVSIGAILGNIALVLLIDRFHRRKLLALTFSMLALLFAVSGTTVLATNRAPGPALIATDVVFGIMHFFFSFGPKTLILVVAAEIFPTVYRGTFYGIAAGMGKVGAIIIRPIIGRTGRLPMALGIRLVVVAPVMLLGAWLAWGLPEVQRIAVKAEEGRRNEEEGGTTGDEMSDLEGVERASLREGVFGRGGDDGRREKQPRVFGSGGRKTGWWTRFWRELETMTLEEVAPNPA
ncbi:major facilitator superfamily domain-containing protein, partial [Bombardia bombarda]